jgi:CHAD domain-containing protein
MVKRLSRQGLLLQPVEQAVCRIALTHLDAARAAHERLKDASDPEALHDFRVALRRLRSVLRAYRPWLKNIPRKLRRRLRTLARSTNVARDTEVMIGWLKHERRSVRVRDRAGFNWLLAHLDQRREEAYAGLADEDLREFGDIDGRLRAALALMESSRPETAPQPRFAGVTTELIRQYSADLFESLAGIQSVEDFEAIHAARIRGKRLRYLLEPLASETRPAVAMIGLMKQFQDRFGALCDAFVQARELVQAVEAVGADQARRRLARVLRLKHAESVPRHALPGLLVLVARLQTETRRHYAVVVRHYLDDRISSLPDQIESVAESLDGRIA